MYSFESRVRYSECTEDARLSLVGMVNYLQDCSTFHSEHMGLGLDHMHENHYSWFISAWQIEIGSLPAFTTPIRISTWCSSMKPLLADRNFTITGTDGTPYVTADSLWFVFDTRLGRPIRIPHSQDAYVEDTPRVDLPPTRRKLPVDEPFTAASPIVVSEQHLDTNKHVNNAQYIQMALDAMEEMGNEVEPRRLCVQYESMALLGDTIVPQVHGEEGGATVKLARPTGEPFAVVKVEGALR